MQFDPVNEFSRIISKLYDDIDIINESIDS